MNLENSIKDIISQKMEDGTIEKLVSEQFEKGIEKVLSDLFGSWGSVNKVIEKKIESVITPFIESYDYSKYIIKLDDVLTEVLKNTTAENRKLLGNFKNLILTETVKEIKVSDLFEIWKKYVAENIDTDELEVIIDGSPSYEPVRVSFEMIEDDSESWSSWQNARLIFECDHDEEMNFEINLSRWKKGAQDYWDIEYKCVPDIRSLRRLNDFEISLMALAQNSTKLIINKNYYADEVCPEAEPEASFS